MFAYICSLIWPHVRGNPQSLAPVNLGSDWDCVDTRANYVLDSLVIQTPRRCHVAEDYIVSSHIPRQDECPCCVEKDADRCTVSRGHCAQTVPFDVQPSFQGPWRGIFNFGTIIAGSVCEVSWSNALESIAPELDTIVHATGGKMMTDVGKLCCRHLHHASLVELSDLAEQYAC